MNMIFSARINNSLKESRINWKVALAFFTYLFHEFGHWIVDEILGNGIWKVFYRSVFLGCFNENQLRAKEKSIRLEINLV